MDKIPNLKLLIILFDETKKFSKKILPRYIKNVFIHDILLLNKEYIHTYILVKAFTFLS